MCIPPQSGHAPRNLLFADTDKTIPVKAQQTALAANPYEASLILRQRRDFPSLQAFKAAVETRIAVGGVRCTPQNQPRHQPQHPEETHVSRIHTAIPSCRNWQPPTVLPTTRSSMTAG